MKMMNKDAPLYKLPDATTNELTLLFTVTKQKAINQLSEIENAVSNNGLDRAFLLEMIRAFWKGYSMGVTDSMRVIDNVSAIACIQQAEEYICELFNELKVQSFLDEIDEYERRGSDAPA